MTPKGVFFVRYFHSQNANLELCQHAHSVLNTTDAQDLTIEAGDTISAKIVVDKGSLSIKIQKDGEKPIYESNGISTSNEFDVEIDESGTYTVEVTGKKAKGSISFIVQSN